MPKAAEKKPAAKRPSKKSPGAPPVNTESPSSPAWWIEGALDALDYLDPKATVADHAKAIAAALREHRNVPALAAHLQSYARVLRASGDASDVPVVLMHAGLLLAPTTPRPASPAAMLAERLRSRLTKKTT